MHLPYDLLETRLRKLPAPPRDEGTVALVVARPAVDERLTPQRCRLTPEGGVDGDRWALRPNPNPAAQITVMRADVARLIGNGQPLALFGDNLQVELDLSRANLPTGTRLQIGTALCEVTPQPHTGCGKFAARFGADARAVTNAAPFLDWRLRGIYIRVIEAGEVGPGDAIRVLSRPAPE
ncbi:MAG TPA: MOSC domain-containing protein [Armatimonadota bacterium]|nr:MOSC domain-containing protein [Armatimonadota bacterium]